MYSIQYILKKILFPNHCCVCKKHQGTLCPSCIQNIQIIPRIRRLDHCTLVTLLEYHHKSIAKIIWELKYKNNREVRHIILELLKPYIINVLKEIHIAENTSLYIISVPKNKTDAIKQRDFDHGHLLAKGLQAILPYNTICITHGLIKNTHKRQAEEKSRKERIAAMKHSINPTIHMGKYKHTNAPLIIIDDVTTTGATRDEMVRVMKQYFTGPIIFIALAH